MAMMRRDRAIDQPLRPGCPCFRPPVWTEFVRWPDVDGAEHWVNSRYGVLKRARTITINGGDVACVRLGISNYDQSARRDWREFQRIKNELAGPEMVAIELYPEDSKVVDPSNWFILWCVPAGYIDCHLGERNVRDPHPDIPLQRPFAEGGHG